ncbi:unnamed protein product [Camellia sinensis]
MGKKEPKPESKPGKQPKLPENYHTCFIYRLYRKVVRVIYPEKKTNGKGADIGNNNTHHETDVESPDIGNNNTHHKTDVESPVHLHDIFPPNYKSRFEPVKHIYKAFLFILGCGSIDINKVLDKKTQNVWAIQILNKLLSRSMTHVYENNGQKPQDNDCKLQHPEDDIDLATPVLMQNPLEANKNNQKNEDDYGYNNETPVLIAAKNGVMEIVEKIVEYFPMAVHDVNSDGKGMMILAVENRQTVVFEYLLGRHVLRGANYNIVDEDGNSALHLAAKISDRPWLIPGLKMQWEIKWYENITSGG